MKKKRYSEEQIADTLRQAEARTLVKELIRKLGVYEHTSYRWKKKYVGMGVSEIRPPKQLEEETRKQRKITE